MSYTANEKTNPLEQLQQDVRSELDHSRRSLREITLMLDQSQAELAKLAQRNAAITAHLQQVTSQFESMSRADIRLAYREALDAQQRLLVMRGQLEKLQADQAALTRYVTFLERSDQALSANEGSRIRSGLEGIATVEMLVNAQEAERLRLSQQMHDGPAQTLSNFVVQADIASRYLDINPSRAKDELTALKTVAMNSFQKIRMFIAELRPMMLDDLGLIPTIRRYIDDFKDSSGMDVTLQVKGTDKRYESYIEVFIFRTLQDLLSNTMRCNTDNPGRVQVALQMNVEDSFIRVTLSDNGMGFDENAEKDSGVIAIKLIKERVEMLGGYIEIDAGLGRGTRITLQIPCAALPATPGKA